MKRRSVIAILLAAFLAVALSITWVFWIDPSIEPNQASPSASPPPETAFAEGATLLPQSSEPGSPPTTGAVQELWEEFSEELPEGWQPWAVVANAQTGQVIFESGIDTPHTPASVTKVLTGFFALTYLDPLETLSTGVSKDDSTLYLWGEGDLTLAAGKGDSRAPYGRAGVSDIADQVVAELAGETGPFALVYQAEFMGEKRAEAWFQQDVEDYAGDVAAFAIDTGRIYPGAWEFVPDSAQGVAEVLEEALVERGVKITEVLPGGKPPEGATVIAQVESAPLIDQIRFMLETSDNTMAEQLCQMADLAAGTANPTFQSSTTTLVETLQQAGVSVTGIRLGDCSGLDEHNRIPPRVLLETLQASFDQPGTAVLTRLLPVAAVSGTLTGRLEDGESQANYSAKTGSLGRTSTIAGIGTTASGGTIYVLVGVDDVPDGGAWWAREPIDSFLEALFAL